MNKEKRFHNDFIIERFIKESANTTVSEAMEEMAKYKLDTDTDKEALAITDLTLRILIKRAQAELSVAKDKEYYGRQLDGLYDAQAYVARLTTSTGS